MKERIEDLIFGMRHRMTVVIWALLISLAVLLLTSFAAFTYSSVEDKMDRSTADLRAMEDYYGAEDAASGLIADFQKEKRELSANLNGISTEETGAGDVEVTRIDDRIYFAVPAGRGTVLDVEAVVTDEKIEIIRWCLEDTP